MPNNDRPENLQDRLIALQSEHRELDTLIAELSANPPSDDLMLRRMKKRKLQLKDEISLAERLLTPDEPA